MLSSKGRSFTATKYMLQILKSIFSTRKPQTSLVLKVDKNIVKRQYFLERWWDWTTISPATSSTEVHNTSQNLSCHQKMESRATYFVQVLIDQGHQQSMVIKWLDNMNHPKHDYSSFRTIVGCP